MAYFTEEEQKTSVGVGLCDFCYIRLFKEDEIMEIKGKLICEDCVQEGEHYGSAYQKSRA